MDARPAATTEQDSNTEAFLMHGYKVIPCSKRYRHDWSVCPFAHTGEMAARRDPKSYLPIFCYHSKQRLPCPRGEQCTWAHNLFEYWLHPARYRTELCQFGMGCTRPVCFFAHNEAQLRHTGMPGGPQPVVAPPEPLVGAGPAGAAGLAAAGGAPGPHRSVSQDPQTLLSSISDAAVKMHMSEAAAMVRMPQVNNLPDHAISDVLPVLGGGATSRVGRSASSAAAFGAHAPAGALNSMPLPRLDWPGSGGAQQDGGMALQQAIAAQQLAYVPGGAGAGGDLAGLNSASAALALAQAQMQAQAQGVQAERRSQDLRRSISEAAALASSQPQRGRQSIDMQALLAATSGPMAMQQQQQPLLDQLQCQLAAMQLAGGDAAAAMAMAAASAPLVAPHLSNSAPLPPVTMAPLLGHQASDVAALAAALHAQHTGGRHPSPQLPLMGAQQLSAPASPGGSGGATSPHSAPLSALQFPLQRAPGSSRAQSPALFTGTSSDSGAQGLLVLGDESLPLDKVQEQLADAPRRTSPSGANGRDNGARSNTAPLPAAPKAAGEANGIGREAAAQLLAQMPESTVRDLLRVLAAGQAVLSQPAA